MKEVADGLMQEAGFKPLILEPLEVFGVDRFAESAVIVKARIKTLPLQQWTVGREMNRRIKKRFAELGIVMPFPQRTVHKAT
jgi:small conductance mechanosensitive channel